MGFGMTLASNLGYQFFDSDPVIKFSDNPETVVALSLCKSAWFSLLWPSIPLVIAENPKNFFVVGNMFKGFEFEFKEEE
jgi:hypothetical protein